MSSTSACSRSGSWMTATQGFATTDDPRAEIATCAFDDGDIAFLLRGLARLGLPAKALRGRIHFDAEGTVRLSELIAPFVPPSMRYKLHPEVERGVLFEPSAVQAGPVEVLYDAVEVQDVTDELRSDTTFFLHRRR